MKFKKIISLFTILFLSGCSTTKTISVSEANEVISSIDEHIQSEDFVFPTHFTFNYDVIENDFDFDTTTQTSSTSSMNIKVDFEKEYIYYKTDNLYSDSNGNEELFSFYEYIYKLDDGTYVDALSMTINRKDTTRLYCQFDGINTTNPYGEEFPTRIIEVELFMDVKQISSNLIELINSLLDADLTEDNIEENFKLSNVTNSNFNGKYTGNENGDFGIDISYKASITDNLEDIELNEEFEFKEYVSFKNYLPFEINEINFIDIYFTEDGQDNHQTIGRKGKATYNYNDIKIIIPDLTGFTRVDPVSKS